MDQCLVGSVAPGDLNGDRTRDWDGTTVVADVIPHSRFAVVKPVLHDATAASSRSGCSCSTGRAPG